MMLEKVRTFGAANDDFSKSVFAGLSRPQKTISSRWLYDARGSELFEDITRLDDYYPTRAETEILKRDAGAIADFCGDGALLIEYGAGAGRKTEILLDALARPRLYAPIDIASEVLEDTARRISRLFPRLPILPVIADFNQDFDMPAGLPPGPRTAFFPGSTIGNLHALGSVAFLNRIRKHTRSGGTAVIGIDLKKDVSTLLNAYDDREGVTAAFNLNLLTRINRDLSGAFPLDRFKHEARWNIAESAVEMHLVSLDARIVGVSGRKFAFRAGETIHTETSRKYDIAGFAALAGMGGWRLVESWLDAEGRFAVVGLRN
jgi:dimethylhistidine N-methyltransferase